LKKLLRKQIKDEKVLRLIDLIIDSFKVSSSDVGNRGIPLGNVTSQIFSNIYLHELDHFVKHGLQEPFYLRYCDDWIFINQNPIELKRLIPKISYFLERELKLELHPKKIILSKWTQGIDQNFPEKKLRQKKFILPLLKDLERDRKVKLEGEEWVSFVQHSNKTTPNT
jgi:hypothetical protein